jgi:hypothetical protein
MSPSSVQAIDPNDVLKAIAEFRVLNSQRILKKTTEPDETDLTKLMVARDARFSMAVIDLANVRPSRKTHKGIKNELKIRKAEGENVSLILDQDFEYIADQCASGIVSPFELYFHVSGEKIKTRDWDVISRPLAASLVTLHERGAAHSIGICINKKIVAGTMGVGIGSVFYKQSNFCDASSLSREPSNFGRMADYLMLAYAKAVGFQLYVDDDHWKASYRGARFFSASEPSDMKPLTDAHLIDLPLRSRAEVVSQTSRNFAQISRIALRQDQGIQSVASYAPVLTA